MKVSLIFSDLLIANFVRTDHRVLNTSRSPQAKIHHVLQTCCPYKTITSNTDTNMGTILQIFVWRLARSVELLTETCPGWTVSWS